MTHSAVVNSPRRFYLLPGDQDLGVTDLVLDVTDVTGARVPGSPFSVGLVVAPVSVSTVGIYQSTAVTFASEGVYVAVWSSAAKDLVVNEQVVVTSKPSSGVHTALNHKQNYLAPGALGGLSDVELKVFKTAAATEMVQEGSNYSTTEASPGVYQTPLLLLQEEAVYLLLWTSPSQGYSFTQIVDVLVVPPATTRHLTVVVADTKTPGLPYPWVQVLLSTADGTPVDQTVTDGDGIAHFRAVDGSYVVTARDGSRVFNRNNIVVSVAEPVAMPNRFFLLTESFQPTFDANPLFSAAQTSRMLVDLVDLDGTPVVGTGVLVSNAQVPSSLEASAGRLAGLVGAHKLVKTDGNGHAEVSLLRGTDVIVALEGTSIRRTFTVPAQESFRLFDLLTRADDSFDVLQPVIVAAERRT